jgi:ribonuclease T2
LASFAAPAIFAALLLALAGVTGTASAQDRRQNEPGKFDYYVLALSWSPSFCAANAERAPARSKPDPQCGPRPYSFVVHGLWPQYERGFPEFCQVPAPRLNRGTVSAMFDLMRTSSSMNGTATAPAPGFRRAPISTQFARPAPW